MIKGASLAVTLMAAIAALPSLAQQNYRAVADTTFSNKATPSICSDLAYSTTSASAADAKSFFNNAMEMLDGFPSFDAIDSILQVERNVFIDSSGNGKKFNQRVTVLRSPQHRQRQMRFQTDSLGENQSVVVLSDGNKTTIIRNGKDSTVVDGPAGQDMSFFDMPALPPRFGAMPGWVDRDFDMPMPFGGPASFEAENPSEQELEMLKRSGAIPSANIANPLDVYELKLNFTPRSKTLSLAYRAGDLTKTSVKVIGQDGKPIDEASLVSRDGQFRRTFKANMEQEYVYVVISANKLFSVSKFWL